MKTKEDILGDSREAWDFAHDRTEVVVYDTALSAMDEYAKQRIEPIDNILLDFADKQGWAVDFSDESYDGAKEAPMDRIGLLVHICEIAAQFTEHQSLNK